MKYIITCRCFSEELVQRFGQEFKDDGKIEVELTDTQVVELIMEFGRAEIRENEADLNQRFLFFQNDYD